jgi:hypothetical protein
VVVVVGRRRRVVGVVDELDVDELGRVVDVVAGALVVVVASSTSGSAPFRMP